MSRFHILYLPPYNIWFYALNQEFAQLSKTNPGWSYTLMPPLAAESKKPELIVMDCTAEETVLLSVLPTNSSQLLVLVRASQKRLIHFLLAESRCSLLCVDEPQFAMRTLVEDTCKKKRFLSPHIRQILNANPLTQQPIFFTEAESTVLNLLQEGKKGIEISQVLFRSQKTVSTHKRNIMRKLGVRDDFSLKRKLKMIEEMA